MRFDENESSARTIVAPSEKNEKFTASTDTVDVAIKHEERVYQKWKGSNYVLPADEEERRRLDLQHLVIRRSFGNKFIYPCVKISPGDRVLESGAGSGAWIMEAAKVLGSEVQIDGFDIEGRNFPRHPPSNVSFCLASVTELPSAWTNRYKFVHQSLLTAALQKPQWEIALSEIHRVLQPGGWVQLIETGGTWNVVGPYSRKFLTMYERLTDKKNLFFDTVSALPDLLADAGFTDIHVVERDYGCDMSSGTQEAADAREGFIGMLRGLKTPVLKLGGLGLVYTSDEFDADIAGLEHELSTTPNSCHHIAMILAQKRQ
ncbi:S-adenosyl-L-methionine-dependent methyltransferase [Schizophyllum commune Tattone D]|nr:S-adenosyl-L-methionine-dependent methyltransferase [Schizophyllum commune Loenen D]KAI5834291.1 S-adenosyl-L-methionine-dependent methyltransferase [Schizophyllum commune Tattone D]